MPAIPATMRQVVSYGFVGLVQIGLDWACFIVLTSLGVPPGPANVAGRVAGAMAGFWANGKWTFAERGQARVSRIALYRFIATWLATTALSTLVVLLVNQNHGLHWAWVVKPVADALLAAIGFTLSKFWIYR
jgi:putative flippase GtrA